MTKVHHQRQLQHYVPQFMLRRFAKGTGKKRSQDRLWVYDKWARRVYPNSVAKTAAENGFYYLDIEGQELCLEEPLSNLEDLAAPLFARIVNQESLVVLSAQERTCVATFVGVQLLRTPQNRYVHERFNEDFRKLCAQWGIQPEAAFVDAATEAQRASMEHIVRFSPVVAEMLLTKHWSLLRAPPDVPFWISDHPVVLTNNLNDGGGIRGNLGLQSPGIEIYMPLSPTLTLGILCPTVVEPMLELHEKSLGLQRAGIMPSPIDARALQICRQFAEQRLVSMTRENAIRQNSLQVCESFRYLYALVREFGLADEMLTSNPGLQSGRTMAVGTFGTSGWTPVDGSS